MIKAEDVLNRKNLCPIGKKVESAGNRLNRTGFRTTMETGKLNRVSAGGK